MSMATPWTSDGFGTMMQLKPRHPVMLQEAMLLQDLPHST